LRACEFPRLAKFFEGQATLEHAFSSVLPPCQRHHPFYRGLETGLGTAADFDSQRGRGMIIIANFQT
jgi:hypothetical protein